MPPSPQQRKEQGVGLDYELNQDGHERAPTPLPAVEEGAEQLQPAALAPLQEEDQPGPANEIQRAPAPHPLSPAVEDNALKQIPPPPVQEENRPGPGNEIQRAPAPHPLAPAVEDNALKQIPPPPVQEENRPGPGNEIQRAPAPHPLAPAVEDNALKQIPPPPVQEENRPGPGNKIQSAPVPHTPARAVEENALQQVSPPPVQEENRPGPNIDNQNKIKKRVSFDEALLGLLEEEAAKRKFEKTLWEAAVEREAALFCLHGPIRLLGKRFLKMSWYQKIDSIATLFLCFAMGCILYMWDLMCSLLILKRQKKEAAAAKNEEKHTDDEI